jgi:group I intron endonuclease
MKIIIEDGCCLENPGVYVIRNTINNCAYIGSSTMRVIKRVEHHISMLRANKHKNSYLQNAFNKYGESSFCASIIENTEKQNTLEREQYWIDYNKEKMSPLYNINPLASGTPNMSKETILKRAENMKRRYASGELQSSFYKGHTPWNKGRTDVDYSYLKGVKKTISEKVLNKLKKQSEEIRDISPRVYVYDVNYNFLGKFRCAKDLEEWSLTEHNNLPIKSRFEKERMGKPLNFLSSGNINKACKTGKFYKGLRFSNQPLYGEIHIEKLSKNGEGCDS